MFDSSNVIIILHQKDMAKNFFFNFVKTVFTLCSSFLSFFLLNSIGIRKIYGWFLKNLICSLLKWIFKNFSHKNTLLAIKQTQKNRAKSKQLQNISNFKNQPCLRMNNHLKVEQNSSPSKVGKVNN